MTFILNVVQRLWGALLIILASWVIFLQDHIAIVVGLCAALASLGTFVVMIGKALNQRVDNLMKKSQLREQNVRTKMAESEMQMKIENDKENSQMRKSNDG